MQTFLIFISFILNIAALLAIVILYTRQNRLLEMEKKQERNVKEMEDVISSCLMEMKEDNERFIQQLHAVRDSKFIPSHEKVNKIMQTAEKELNVEVRKDPVQTDSNLPVAGTSYKRQNAAKAYKKQPGKDQAGNNNNVNDSKGDSLIEEDPIYSRIKRLQEKGFTLDDIAKELGKGVTEIELILKFRQNQK